MYIQITTRCNMKCAHCCNSCTPDGIDMSLQTFKKCLEFDDESIALGGGEPTIHPKFWEMLGLSIGHCDYVWLATNGKKTKMALSLAKLARRGVIGVALSLDDWHGIIDREVIHAFTSKVQHAEYMHGRRSEDLREIRNVGKHNDPINAGRCDWGRDGCTCSELVITPLGDVHGCGCDGAPYFGNVCNDVNIPDEWNVGECYKEQKVSEGP